MGSNSGAGSILSLSAYASDGTWLAGDEVVLQPAMQEISVEVEGIGYVIFGESQACVWVLDDLGYTIDALPVESQTWGALKSRYR